MDETQKYEKKTDYVETIALIDGECIEYDMCNTRQEIPKRLNSEILITSAAVRSIRSAASGRLESKRSIFGNTRKNTNI